MVETFARAPIDVLVVGYADMPSVAGTVGLVRDGDRVIVVDPGMVKSRALILDPLERLGISPDDVSHVFVSHHHLDHTVNIALFR
jgi:glyoxylase-like metal-dependent hydrolase (beta-lactamase superfamily II)